MTGWMRGMWRITLWHPEHDSGTYTYLVPHWQARTEVAARAIAADRHTDRASVASDPACALEMVVGEVAFRPAVRSRERAVAWVALVKHDAISEDGWVRPASGHRHERDDLWRQEVRATHQRYREQVIGFGNSIADIMTSAEADMAWDLEPYPDTYGRIRWDDVRTDVHRAAQSHIWHTPFGAVWILHA
ncbi:hypothetical protein AB0B50_40180 [Streptomyces sp. NPDC041068]|uniref:hypothetical protein n=1 Tax=Streptomyces sp. NPDC041068 TaxID=3155130 RepID=UPI0033F2BB5F